MKELHLTGVLVYLLTPEGLVWLALMKRKFLEGYLNGYGGKIEDGDTEIETIVRELDEECEVSLDPTRTQKRAIITFHNRFEEEVMIETCFTVHTYIVEDFIGTPKESQEMGVSQLFLPNNLPFEDMSPGDRDWVPQVLNPNEKQFTAEVYTDYKERVLFKPTVITPVETLPTY